MAKHRRGRRILDALLLAVCVTCAAVACAIVAETMHEGDAYTSLPAQVVSEDTDPADNEMTIDWESLREQNPDIAAWLSVDGTQIDYPVVGTREGDPDGYYLHHDFWRQPSFAGCLYLDGRCRADGSHALVYGHHMGYTGQMFSPIFDTYRQDEFDRVGDMSWTTPAKGTARLHPAFALSVDKTFGDIQTFGFAGATELRTWLAALAGQATARAANCDELCASATRAVTLVTCSSTIGGQRARTLLVFVQ